MNLGSIIVMVLVFLVFYQVFVQLSRRGKQARSESSDQNQLLIEKFERLDRAFKYELNDISRSLASLQALHTNMPASPEVLDRLDKIESAIKSLGTQTPPVQNPTQAPPHLES